MNKSKLLVVIGALLSISFFISGCGKNSVLQPVVKSKPQGNTGGIPVLDTQTKLDSRDFEKSPEQYWTETGINLNDYAQWINNNDSQQGRKEGCYSEEKLTIACLYSLTYLADILDLALTFESNTNDEVVVRNGPLKVIKKQKELGDKKTVYKQVKGMAATLLANYFDYLVGQFKGERNMENVIHFPLLIAQLVKVGAKDLSSMQIGQLMNAYLEMAEDPHTGVQPLAAYEDERKKSFEQFGGVGARIKKSDDYVEIFEVIPDYGADKGGLQAGDKFKEVNGASVVNSNEDQVARLLRGQPGTQVSVVIIRGEKEMSVTLTRSVIEIKNVSHKLMEGNGLKYGYIKLNSFMSESTCADTKKAIKELGTSEAYVVDVRGNPGGSLDEVTCIVGLFVGSGKVSVIQKDRQGRVLGSEITREKALPELAGKPVVVLINAYSASASEILAGALQDYKRAWILGQTSFGKGTVQRIYEVYNSYGMPTLIRRQTISKFYLPSDRSNQLSGVVPDFTVPTVMGVEEPTVSREKDIYVNAIEETNNQWEQPRPGEVANLLHCMNTTGVAESLYNSNDFRYADYQGLVAADLVACDLERATLPEAM